MRYQLNIQLLDFWRVGSGRGRGKQVDSIVDRNANSLPYIPGRMLKGLLREAVTCLQSWGHCSPRSTEVLFGRQGADADGQGRNLTTSGCCMLSNAHLSDDLQQWFQTTEGEALREQLFFIHSQTAINAKGVAVAKSLRGMEATAPLTLIAELELLTDGDNEKHQQQLETLKQALPLIQSIGAGRNRGYGRANITLEPIQ